MDPASSFIGFSNIISQGQIASILTRGSVPIKLALAQEAGGLPKVGSVIWGLLPFR
jgi:regulator of extracellular matrix RemA (YlzA/DUF370 family)